MSNPAPTLNQINAFNATQGTTIDFNIIGGTEVIRSNKIYIYDLSDNSLICTHLYVSTESIHELPSNTSSSIVYASGKSSADFTNNTQYYAQIQTFTDVGGTQGGSGLSIAKLFWCLPTPTLTLSTIPTTISTTSYNVSATYTPNTSGSATNEIQEFQFNLYSAIGALLQTSGVVLYGEGVDLSYNFSGLEVDSTYYVTLDVTTTQGMNVSAQSNTFTVSIDTPTMGSASVVNNGCDGYISVTSNLSSEYEHEESAEAGEIMSFTTDSVNDITELDVPFEPVQDDTPWMSTQNTEPYTFRAVPTQTEDFGHESDTIVGGTVGANQIVGTGTWRGDTNNGITLVSDSSTGTITVSGTATDFAQISFTYPKAMLRVNHVYFLVQPNGASSSTYYIRTGENTFWNYKHIAKVEAEANLASGGLRVVVQSGQTVNFSFRPQMFDLTQMFGSTIADYIYNLEQSTAGAGVAWFRKLFPNSYYAYDAGSLVSVNGLTSHDLVGFNQWDEEWEVGSISTSDGQNTSSSTLIRSKNYVPVIPNMTYFAKAPASSGGNLFYYDADKNYLSYVGFAVNTTYTIPSNARYIRFRMGSEYGTTYHNDICINISDASLNGTYKPYVKHSYPLDSDLTLRGIPKLDASNNLYYDGDVYASDGNVTRKYGVVDLGTLTWNTQATGTDTRLFYGNRSDGKPAPGNTVANAISLYAPTKNINSLWSNDVKGVGISGNGVVAVRGDVLSPSDFKTAMSGVYLVYELATPTTETADPYTNPQVVDPSGTEEYVGSPIPVGHKTTYQRICPISGWDSVSVDVVGANQWDEVWELGGISSSTGQNYSSTTAIRSKNYIPVLPNTTYYFKKDTLLPVFVAYDANKNFIAGAFNGYNTYAPNNIAYTIPSGVHYLRFNASGTTYNNDISINYPSTDTTYHAYNPNSTTYTSTFPKYKQQVSQDKIPYITKNIGDTYADTLTENLVGGTIAWNQSVPDTTTTHTVSGSIASMDDAVAGNFESCVVEINPVQAGSGTPSPDNVRPITGWTGCEVSQAGVNLLGLQNRTAETLTNQQYTQVPNIGADKYYVGFGDTLLARPSYVTNVNISNGSVSFTTVTTVGYGVSFPFRCKPNTTYFKHADTATNVNLIPIYCDASGNYIGKENNGSKDISFTTPSNCYYVLMSIIGNAIGSCSVTGLSINYPSTDHDYHAYNGTTYPVSWQTEAGTVYGGTVDLVTGVLTVTDEMGDLGSYSWSYISPDATYPNGYFYVNVVGKASGLENIIADSYETFASLVGEDFGIRGNANNNRIFVTNSNYSSADTFKTAMNGKKIVYKLATPQTYQLDPVQVACLLGQNNVWCDTGNTTITYPTNHSYQSLSTTHKYYKRINGVESISVGSDVVVDVGTDNIIDLTQMFGTTIADYIYNREQSSSSNMGVKFFKSLFPNDDYDYNSGELISVNASAHVIKDANGNVLHTYPLDSDLVLRGIPKLDASNKLYYDGDVYESDGSVTRKYGIVDLGTLAWVKNNEEIWTTPFAETPNTSGIANILCPKYTTTSWSLMTGTDKTIAKYNNNYMYVHDSAYSSAAKFKTAMSGVYLVYELATPTTEQADPFEENQAIVPNGIEEYTVTEQGDVEMPVGHDSTYYATPIYGGTIDMVSGVLTINMASVGLGTLTWVKNGTRMLSQSLSPVAKSIDTSTIPNAICSQYVPKKWSEVASGGYDGAFCVTSNQILVMDSNYTDVEAFTQAMKDVQLVYELATPIEISLTPQQMQTLAGQNNVWNNTNGGMFLVYQLPITSLLVKRRDVADVSGKWLTLYSVPITQASDMDFTFIDFLNQYGKTYQYALVPVLAQDQSGVVVQIEGGYTVSDNVDSIFDGVYIADQTNVERVKAGVGYGNIDMNQGVGSITPIGSKYPIVITNSQNQYHNGSIRGTIVPNDFYSNGNLSRIDMVNKRDELEQFLTNKRAKIIKDWNGKMWLVMIMSNVACSFDDNYGMGMVSFSADWLEVGDPTNQQDLYNAGLINVGGV